MGFDFNKNNGQSDGFDTDWGSSGGGYGNDWGDDSTSNSGFSGLPTNPDSGSSGYEWGNGGGYGGSRQGSGSQPGSRNRTRNRDSRNRGPVNIPWGVILVLLAAAVLLTVLITYRHEITSLITELLSYAIIILIVGFLFKKLLRR